MYPGSLLCQPFALKEFSSALIISIVISSEGIKVNADTLSTFVLAHKEKIKELEDIYKITKENYEKDIADQKKIWEKEKEQVEKEQKDYQQEIKKQRIRQEEEYNYNLKLNRKKDEDEYQDKKYKQEKELINKKN